MQGKAYPLVVDRLMAQPKLPPGQGRIEAIDLARGVAVALMILSHTVSGLLGIDRVPDWGMVPIHLLTKFSSSLFIMVFGIALAVAFLPKTDAADWPQRRLRLLLRGLEVLFWYKLLTVVEMLPAFPVADIVDTLLYQRSAIWVEILGFYAVALLWLPWVLPLWRRMPLWSRLASPLAVAWLAGWLERHFGFWGIEPLKAILVEDAGHYTWGQLSRLPLVMLGFLIGEAILRCQSQPAFRRRLVNVLAAAGVLMLLGFLAMARSDLYASLRAVSYNAGKHPPELAFMLFSLGGALVILALCLLGDARAAARLRPITIIGSNALKAFIFHLVVIFGLLRWLLEGWQAYSYPQVLGIGLLLVLATTVWIVLSRWVKARV